VIEAGQICQQSHSSGVESVLSSHLQSLFGQNSSNVYGVDAVLVLCLQVSIKGLSGVCIICLFSSVVSS